MFLKFISLLIILAYPVIAFGSSTLPSANQLNTYGPVNAPNSDTESTQYSSFYNSNIQPYINQNQISVQGDQSPFYKFVNQNSSVQVKVMTDPSNLTITQDSSVRFYFVNSPAAYNSSVGLNFNNNFTVNPGNTSLIFANRNVTPGSYVNIPTNLTTAGTSLDLYLLADAGLHQGTTQAKNIWWNAVQQNIDAISHVQVAQFVGTPYYLISFEDEPLTQAIIAANGGFIQNDFTLVMEIIPVPEPATYAILGSLLAIILFRKRQISINSN